MMQAIQVHQFGEPDQLRLEHIPRPEPRHGEVLIRVRAAGVLPMDTYTRRGIMPKKFPYIPGSAFAGVIEKIGEGVTNFHVGQAVCGRATSGAYAEYTATLAEAPPIMPDTPRDQVATLLSLVVEKPQSITFEEAAALSGGATTAWSSLFDDGDLQAGQRVLIHGAAGGVGLFAVQFARWKGARVIATCGTANVAFARSLGADTVVDYTTESFETAARDVDLVLDTVGGETQRRSMKIVRPGGRLVSVYEPPPPSDTIHATMNATFPTNAHLRQIVTLIDAGHVRPVIRQIFPLREAHLAHELSERGHGRGRIVLALN